MAIPCRPMVGLRTALSFPSLDEPLDEMMKRTQHGADPKQAILWTKKRRLRKGGDDQPWRYASVLVHIGQIRPYSISRIWLASKRPSIASHMQALPRSLRLILLLLPVALAVLIFLDTIIFMCRWFDKLIVPDAYHWLLLFISFAPPVYFEFRPSTGLCWS